MENAEKEEIKDENQRGKAVVVLNIILKVILFPIDMLLLMVKGIALLGLIILAVLKGMTYRFWIELKGKLRQDRPCTLNSFLFGVLLVVCLPFWMLMLMVVGVYLEMTETLIPWTS